MSTIIFIMSDKFVCQIKFIIQKSKLKHIKIKSHSYEKLFQKNIQLGSFQFWTLLVKYIFPINMLLQAMPKAFTNVICNTVNKNTPLSVRCHCKPSKQWTNASRISFRTHSTRPELSMIWSRSQVFVQTKPSIASW